MKRCQVYLDPYSVSIIDEAEKYSGISRSALIRLVVDALAQNLSKVLAENISTPKKYPCLDGLVAAIEAKQSKEVDFSERKDGFYYQD